MSWNIAALRRSHDQFLKANAAMVVEVLSEGIDVVNASIYEHPGFKPITHKTQDSTKTRVVRTRSGHVLRISNATKRARWLEEGTQPHWIFPNKKKVLRFIGRDGRWVSKKAVAHKGTKPYWFMRNARDRASAYVAPGLERGMQRIARSPLGK